MGVKKGWRTFTYVITYHNLWDKSNGFPSFMRFLVLLFHESAISNFGTAICWNDKSVSISLFLRSNKSNLWRISAGDEFPRRQWSESLWSRIFWGHSRCQNTCGGMHFILASCTKVKIQDLCLIQFPSPFSKYFMSVSTLSAATMHSHYCRAIIIMVTVLW